MPAMQNVDARCDVTVASPEGGPVQVDALPDPRDESRWSADDLVSMGALNTPGVTDGRTVTGFANVEEDFGDAAAGVTIMPFRVEDELRSRGANYIQAGLFKAFAVRDQNLITGQQQYSGRKVAEHVIAALGD
jgi:putative intracellular protease/amidase